MKFKIIIIQGVTAILLGLTTQSKGLRRVFQIAPVGHDIVFIVPCPDIGGYGKYELLLCGISYTGNNRGDIFIFVIVFMGKKMLRSH